MVSGLHIKRRHRVRLVLLAVLALLLQQTALVAYACSANAMPMAAGGVQTMSMPSQPTNGEAVQPLCLQCCMQPVPVSQGDQLPSVPPSQLAAVMPMQPVVPKLPAWPATKARAAAERMLGLAPPLKYRVLLI